MSRKIREIDFGPVCGAAGVGGFFADPKFPEYRHQWWFKHFRGYDFEHMGFTSKTTTLLQRVGNMPLRKDGIRPRHLRPKCIYADLRKGIALNSVGLSGPGAERLLKEKRWQQREEPFRISFMPVEKTLDGKCEETKLFMALMKKYLPGFRTKEIMIQLNITCPNVGLATGEADGKVAEVHALIAILAELNLPIEVKLVVTMEPRLALRIASHEACDSVCISNTIPWGQLPNQIDWRKLFGLKGKGPVSLEESPLAKIGGGGLSGWPLLRIVSRWTKEFRQIGFKRHINAGGGIMNTKDVPVLKLAGADSVFIGSVAMLRPCRVKGIIDQALETFGSLSRVISVAG